MEQQLLDEYNDDENRPYSQHLRNQKKNLHFLVFCCDSLPLAVNSTAMAPGNKTLLVWPLAPAVALPITVQLGRNRAIDRQLASKNVIAAQTRKKFYHIFSANGVAASSINSTIPHGNSAECRALSSNSPVLQENNQTTERANAVLCLPVTAQCQCRRVCIRCHFVAKHRWHKAFVANNQIVLR